MGSNEATPHARLCFKWGDHGECLEYLEAFVISSCFSVSDQIRLNGSSLRRNAWYIYRADVWICLLHPRTIALQRVRRPTHKIHFSKAPYPLPVADTHSFGAFKTPGA